MNNRSNSFKIYTDTRKHHWDNVARKTDKWKSWGQYYHRRLERIYKFIIPPKKRVLEIGCGRGDLLATLKPHYGVGIDFSLEMINRAQKKYPELHFIQMDAHELDINEKFDFIIFSDIVNDLWDVQKVLENIGKISSPHSRIVINLYSHLWEMPLKLSQEMGLAAPTLSQNWLTVEDVSNILYIADFEVIRHWEEILMPLQVPFLTTLANKYLVKLWPFSILALTNIVIARLQQSPESEKKYEESIISVIVPARNESGNIDKIIMRTPDMARETEIIFVEGHSQDNTYETIIKAIKDNPRRDIKCFRQTGKGKGDAVRLGFAQARGDIIMILDADMTVPPEDLPRFYEAIRSGKADFVNGVRLVYPMEKEAMRFFNLVGNKFFSLAFSWLLGQPIKDTLCGTKVFSKDDYIRIKENRSYFGEFDPFGDFDLLFGAAKLNLKIVDMPIRYQERTYGSTQIQRWRHGLLLLRMVVFAAGRIKFV